MPKDPFAEHISGDPACNYCEHPSTPDNRVREFRTTNGVRILRHQPCQDQATTEDSIHNYIAVSSRKLAVNPVLVCSDCGDVTDVGDENEADDWRVAGDTCLNTRCNGKLEHRVGSRADINNNYTNPYTVEGDPTAALNALPKGFAPPAQTQRSGLEEVASNLNRSNNKVPTKLAPAQTSETKDPHVIEASTYDWIEDHLIKGHGWRRGNLGYNSKLLLRLHMQAHEDGAYTVPH